MWGISQKNAVENPFTTETPKKPEETIALMFLRVSVNLW